MMSLLESARCQFEAPMLRASEGETCVAAVLRYHGMPDHAIRVHGDTLADLREALEGAGFVVSAFTGSVDGLRAMEQPSILALDRDGRPAALVVCYGFDAEVFVIGDPRQGIRCLSPAELARSWTLRTLLSPRKDTEPSRERYRCFDMTVVRFGHDRAVVRANRTGTSRLAGSVDLERLFAADAFRTLDAHAARIRARLPRGSNGSRTAGFLKTCVDQGLLTSESDVRDDVARCAVDQRDTSRPPSGISSIGLPTRDRNASLLTALRAYMQNAREHGRSPRFMIADASSVHHQLQMELFLKAIGAEFEMTIDHLDDSWRANLILGVREETGCAPEILRFAVFGSDHCGSNYGANRNTLLLAAAGELTVQVDDDTRLPLRSSPGSGTGLDLSSAVDPNEYWFDETDWMDLAEEDVDFLQLHETLLGRPAIAILREYGKEEIVIDRLDSELLRTVERLDARIGVTFLGHHGDAGTGTNASRLFLNGASLRRLTQPGYEDRIRSRDLLRTVRRRTLSSGQFCVTMNVGLDARDILPPFMPVGRNEDGVFSAVLAACFPECLRGFQEGYVLAHQPPDGRSPFRTPVRFDGFKANDLLAGLIQHLAAIRAPALRAGLGWLGGLLCEYGSLDQPDFDRVCMAHVHQTLGLTAVEIERRLVESGADESPWRSDVSAYRESLEQYVAREDCAAPVDLNGSPSERRSHFRELVRAYGALLLTWPDIVRSARYAIGVGHA